MLRKPSAASAMFINAAPDVAAAATPAAVDFMNDLRDSLPSKVRPRPWFAMPHLPVFKKPTGVSENLVAALKALVRPLYFANDTSGLDPVKRHRSVQRECSDQEWTHRHGGR